MSNVRMLQIVGIPGRQELRIIGNLKGTGCRTSHLLELLYHLRRCGGEGRGEGPDASFSGPKPYSKKNRVDVFSWSPCWTFGKSRLVFFSSPFTRIISALKNTTKLQKGIIIVIIIKTSQCVSQAMIVNELLFILKTFFYSYCTCIFPSWHILLFVVKYLVCLIWNIWSPRTV